METRSSNRLCPTAVNPASSPLLNSHNHSSHPRKAGGLRRRCRSETLPTTTAPGVIVPTIEKIYGQQRSIVQSFLPALQKYKPVLCNHESIKNIFSCPAGNNEIRTITQSVGRMQTRQQQPQHVVRKENIEATRHNGAAKSARQARLQEFEWFKEQKHYVDTKIGSSSPDKHGVDSHPQQGQRFGRIEWLVDGQKRRVRSLSECDPSDSAAYSSPAKNGGEFRFGTNDLTLKRSREDREQSGAIHRGNTSQRQPTKQHQRFVIDAINGIVGTTPNQASLNGRADVHPEQANKASAKNHHHHHSKPILNPKYTKIVAHHLARASTPRHPNKSIAALRKIRSRQSLEKQKLTSTNTLGSSETNGSNQMVVSTNRCATPTVIDSSAGTSERSPNAIKKKVANGGGENADGDDSDTGCSSLDDDDSFDDINDIDNDTLSDFEDSSSPFSSLSLSLDGKASEASFCTTEGVLGRYVASAPLAASLFPNVPPYISFASHSERGPEMPPSIHKVLKWKLTTITPIVIRKVLLNTGFRLLRSDPPGTQLVKVSETETTETNEDDIDETNDWMGVWGKHMKSPCFKTLRSYQKINHIPGSFQIGRKDRVWRNLQTLMTRHGHREFGFMPRTFVIPTDLKQLRRMWPHYNQRNTKWIIKPPASARGTGIKVVNRWSQIPKRKPLIVQRYIERPLLINGSKFDLRLYVLVTSINPLRVYMHTDGLARFASVKYSEKTDTLHDRYMHLTNYSINKLSSNYAKNEDANACKGHKWTVKSLWTHLAAQGINTTGLWGALRNLVLRTVLAGESPINNMTKANMGSRYNCFELFGIDVLLDAELRPWLLEVNISPSLHSASPLDLHVKGPLCTALLNTAMFQVPPRIPIPEQHNIMAEQGLQGLLCYDKRMFVTITTKAERTKHAEFCNKTRDDYLKTILRNLTPDDARTLMIAEDELARSAPLERIFPSSTSHKYLKFIETPRYHNRLLDAWEHEYGASLKTREEGLKMLHRFADDRVHLIVPAQPVKKESENRNSNPSSNDTPSAQGDSVLVSLDDSSLFSINVKNDELGDKHEGLIEQMVPKLMKKEIDDAAAVPPSSQFNSTTNTAPKTLLVERLNGKSAVKSRFQSPQTTVEL